MDGVGWAGVGWDGNVPCPRQEWRTNTSARTLTTDGVWWGGQKSIDVVLQRRSHCGAVSHKILEV